MTAAFDPYYTWLAIPPEEQPPNHYRLLGLRPFEDNLEVIENAANQRMTYLRSFQTGKNSALSQKLLNEVAQARVALLNVEKKAAYDAWLRQQREAAGPQQDGGPAQISTAMYGFFQSLNSSSQPAPPGMPPLPQPASPRLESWRRSRSRTPALVYAGLAAAVLLGAALWWFSSADSREPNRPFERETASAIIPAKSAAPSADPGPTPDTDMLPEPSPAPQNKKRLETPQPEPREREGLGPSDPSRLVGVPQLEMPSYLGPRIPLEDPSKPGMDPQGDPSPMEMLATPPPGEEPMAEPPLRNLADLLSDDVASKSSGRLRLPVPDASAQENARKLLGELYGEEKAAADSSVKKLALVQRLVDDIQGAEEDAARRFVFLSTARDLAVEAAHAERAMEIAGRIADGYEVDRLEMFSECLQGLEHAAQKTAEYAAVARAALPVIDEAIADDRYEMAKQIGGMAAAAARRGREFPIARESVEKVRVAGEEEKKFAAVKDSLDALETNPNDADANLAVGRHYARKGNWEKALPHLARGSDPELKQAAEKELAGAASPEEQAAVGDVWWDLAEKLQNPDRHALRQHAGTWYTRSKVLLPEGVTQRTIETRLKQIAQASDSAESDAPSRETAGHPDKARRLPFNRLTPVFTSSKELLGWNAEGADFAYNNGILDLRDSSIYYAVEAADMAIQAKVKKASGQNVSLHLRNGVNGNYAAWYDGDSEFGIGKTVNGRWENLNRIRVPNRPIEGFVFGFAVTGQTLAAFVNGQAILQAEDSTHAEGSPGLAAVGGNSLFADVQLKLLDKP